MTTSRRPQFKTNSAQLDINKLAIQTGFSHRKARKISAEHLVKSFFDMMTTRNFSLRQWAFNISLRANIKVSFQALAKRLDFRQELFFQSLFQKALLEKLHKGFNYSVDEIFRSFNRVLIEDSTCFHLPTSLLEFFPGARLPHGRKAGGRIQLCINITDHTYESIVIQNYCQNDASFAGHILETIQPKDLIIRDLGYWSIPVMTKITKMKAYFLSRLHIGTSLLCPTTKEVFDLVKFLQKADRQKITQVDIPVLLGLDYQLPVRLVALKSNVQQTNQRIRTAKKQRHKNTSISPKAKYLMSWSLYVTNVTDDVWKCESVLKAYQVRWHIEMMFKSWKSKFNLTAFFKNCNGRNPTKPTIILLLILTWLVSNYIKTYNYIAGLIWNKYKRILSPIQFAGYIVSHPDIILNAKDPFMLERLAYYSCYDKRKDRINHFEKTYMNFLS